ncbi:unnamed protein product [Adineta steineri]|uniref:Uncharacterized protein n=1 Tax=Adineta steineri TaxID=433720 RepID=A0A816D9C7_9BILA|nr:unnamed protein product [Adineta steineri]CAF1631947.1 unnamed protein product [Adineta steineri]
MGSRYILCILWHSFISRFDFKSILKSQFDLICKYIRPEQIVTLILSDDIDTPYQFELFLSIYNIERDFSHLRSLVLLESVFKMTLTTTENYNKLGRHPSYKYRYFSAQDRYRNYGLTYSAISSQISTLNNYISYDDNTSLSNQKYLKISLRNHPFQQMKRIFQSCKKLIELHVNILRAQHKQGYRTISRVQLEELLSSIPHLEQLELEISADIDLIDGNQWEIFLTRHLTNLITSDFKFDLHQYEYNNILLNTFRSSFWLNIKRWIVVSDPIDSSFKTVPCFARKSIHFSNDYSQPTTTDDSLPSFDRYMYIREITLSSFINNDWIERLGSIVIFNQIEELNIGRNQLLEILIKVKPVMPQLKRLIVSCLSLNTL